MLKKINFLYVLLILFIYLFYYLYDFNFFNLYKVYCHELNNDYYKNSDEFKLYFSENPSVNEIYCCNDSLSGVLNILIAFSFIAVITELLKII